MAEYDTMVGINTRGTFLVVKHALPYLKQGTNAHILTLCPKPQLDERWFGSNLAYTLSKFSMGMLAFGLSAEQRVHGIASNALWPFTTIDTDGLAECNNPHTEFTGNFCIDEIVLREAGVCNFEQYSSVPGTPLSELSQDHMIAPDQLSRLMSLRQQASD
ncbi:hypothetical protein BX667DRAFT_494134 [Coemansia mojavensis]|nr:hypothetical protein BX667DRAFT_494134 [Coemansia mojavensis]